MRKNDDIGGILFLIFLFIALPIMIFVWIIKGIAKLGNSTNNQTRITHKRKQDDDLTIEDMIILDEILDDDDF